MTRRNLRGLLSALIVGLAFWGAVVWTVVLISDGTLS